MEELKESGEAMISSLSPEVRGQEQVAADRQQQLSGRSREGWSSCFD
jgi:hypothetical protein